MSTNEEGEFELVLGRQQLLSVFFIVVSLLGIFFAIGYIVGRGKGSRVDPITVASSEPAAKPIEVESPSTRPVDPGSRPSPTATKPTTQSDPPPSQPDPPKPEPAKVETPKPEPSKPEPPKPEPRKPEPVKPTPPPPASTGGSGIYLQVAAANRPEAEVLAGSLAKKGFKAVTVAVPGSGSLLRVLVGPVAAADVSSTKEALAQVGFKQTITRKQ